MLTFQHPTSLLLVDDDELFLDSFSFRYSKQFCCRTSSDPHAASRIVRDSNTEWLENLDLFEKPSNFATIDAPGAERLVKVRRHPFKSLAEHPRHTQTVSLVIVDYAMPKMSGVEFCRKIKDLPARKLLLTGKAGEATAIAAFNEGLIDRFLMKQDAELSVRLPQEIQALQRLFFQTAALSIEATEASPSLSFLLDPVVKGFLSALLVEHQVIEHFAWDDPQGLRITDANGCVSHIILADVERMRAQHEIAEAMGGPRELVDRLRTHDFIGWFPTETGFFEEVVAHCWQSYVLPAKKIPNSLWWHAIGPVGMFEPGVNPGA